MLNGQVLNERYRIKEKIGGGGMANVYLAADAILNREVAIKVLRLEFANDDEFIERFDREAKAATSLSHPNIVNIYDIGEEDDILYMVMEYVDGMTLKEYIQEKGPLHVEEVIRIMQQLTDAIAHAHTNGLIHRDIKPQNILMDQHGNVKITDFGIAIALSATSLTETNSVLGSVHYLSPEQARGGVATKKSDIYSLGIVMYELLTGELAFTGESAVSVALKHLQDDMPSVRSLKPEIPQSVENIVLKATAKDSFHRYETVFAMEEALNRSLDPENLNEARYVPPVEDGEETKAIPIITDSKIQANTTEQPIDPLEEIEEEEAAEKKSIFKNKWFITAIILAVLLIGVIITVFVLSKSSKPKEVKIPDVIDWELEDAREELEGLHLIVIEEEVPSEDIEEGHVANIDPRVGRTVKVDSEVTLFISTGIEKDEFDDYVGQQLDEAKRDLRMKGYLEENIRVFEKHSDKPEGEILDQIKPEPGSETIPEETEIVFEVSVGEKPIMLGNIVGLSVDEAKNYAEGHDLTIEVVSEEHSDDVEKGLIMKQDPKQGEELLPGDTIKVTVSKGKEEIPPRAVNVSFIVKFDPMPIPIDPTPGDNGDDDGDDAQEELPSVEYPSEQNVKIYVKDTNNSISDVYREVTITEDESFNLTLYIEEGKTGRYKVIRDDEVVYDQEVSYKDGE